MKRYPLQCGERHRDLQAAPLCLRPTRCYTLGKTVRRRIMRMYRFTTLLLCLVLTLLVGACAPASAPPAAAPAAPPAAAPAAPPAAAPAAPPAAAPAAPPAARPQPTCGHARSSGRACSPDCDHRAIYRGPALIPAGRGQSSGYPSAHVAQLRTPQPPATRRQGGARRLLDLHLIGLSLRDPVA